MLCSILGLGNKQTDALPVTATSHHTNAYLFQSKKKRSNGISDPLQQSPWSTELSEGEARWKEEKKTRESYILIHKLAFGTPDSEDQKRPPVTLLSYFFIYSMQFWTESSPRHCSDRDGRLDQGIPHFFFHRQSPSLHGSPKLWERKYLCLPTEFPCLCYLLTLTLFHFWQLFSQVTGAHGDTF